MSATRSAAAPTGDDELRFLAGDGSAAALMRAIDWSTTDVGPISTWPSALKTMVATMLHSRHPMFLWWGPSLVQFYNDAYIPSFGLGKHPRAMGQRGRDCWPEIWSIIGPQIDDVMSRGTASWNEDALVPIFRNGRIEEVYWTYGYSPVFDDAGRVGGTLVVCTETTARVVGERRLGVVRSVADVVLECADPAAVTRAFLRAMRAARHDLGFVLAYRRDGAGRWRLSDSTHEDLVSVGPADAAIRERLARGAPDGHAIVEHPPVAVARAPWPEPVSRAVIVERAASGGECLAFGVSPRLPLDSAHVDFLVQIVEQLELATAGLDARRVRAAMENERRNLLLQAPVATALLTGPRHTFQLANALCLQIVGRDVAGKECLEAFPELADTPVLQILDRVYETGAPFVTQELLVRIDREGRGTPQDCYFRFNLAPLRDARGDVYGMTAIAVDITELVASRILVEKRDVEREKLLLELEAANHAKDEFLATVSHELRTPLTAILGWARMLSDGNHEPARLHRGLTTIERNANAQAQLIEDILDVSRIISGKMRITMRPVDPRVVVMDAVDAVRPLAAAKGVRLHIELGGAKVPETVIADQDRLQQVVWNLLTNAIKFTPKSGSVEVRLAERDGALSVTVTDTGAGIAPEFLPHVFDRFRQDDATTTKKHGGLGLGLSIVRHLVELHGGTVSAQSEGPGRGATMVVRIPVHAASTPRDDAPPAANGAGHEPRRLDGVRALLVDDHRDARELVALVLEQSGATLVQAASAAAALEALEALDFDVVLSDIGMPGEDGYTFIQRLRAAGASARNRDVPAVALTAYARAEDREHARAAGFQEHVAKPIEPRQLVQAVATLLAR